MPLLFVNGGGYGGTPTPPPPPPPPPLLTHPTVTPPPAPAGPAGANIRGYVFGWCTYYVAQQCPWIPAGLGDAHTWAALAPEHGLEVTLIPTVGSVVCYGSGGGYSQLGHVAVVRAVYGLDSFEVQEMAYAAWDTVDTRVSNMTDVVGFILPPGVSAGVGQPVAPPAPAQGLDGARSSWASLIDFLSNGLPVRIGELAATGDALRSL